MSANLITKSSADDWSSVQESNQNDCHSYQAAAPMLLSRCYQRPHSLLWISNFATEIDSFSMSLHYVGEAHTSRERKTPAVNKRWARVKESSPPNAEVYNSIQYFYNKRNCNINSISFAYLHISTRKWLFEYESIFVLWKWMEKQNELHMGFSIVMSMLKIWLVRLAL